MPSVSIKGSLNTFKYSLIKFHLEPNSQGQITIEELLNLGNYLREYLKIFKEPFVDIDERKIYEWENDEGVRFRIATDKIKGEGHNRHYPPLMK